MSKRFLTLGILVIVLAGIFVPSADYLHAQTCPSGKVQKCFTGSSGYSCTCVDANIGGGTANTVTGEGWSLANYITSSIAKWASQALMGLSSLVLVFCGKFFDIVLDFTIVRMAENLGSSSGMGAGITSAWATLRDIANMVFIFVLLYAAFKAMFDTNFGGFQSTVKNIIIVALLINFSLFFSKVVIDASNIVAIGFYNSITSSTRLEKSETIKEITTSFEGISAGYMNMLGVQTLYSSKLLDNPTLVEDSSKMMVVGIMSSVFMLVTAVILLISGIMFAARFIILIFIMILSSLALIAIIIPGQKKYFDQWKDALIAQSFFAPIYFALTWVVFRVGSSLLPMLKTAGEAAGMQQSGVMADMFTKPGSTIAILINYVLIIGFAIAALVISKSMASKTPGFKQVSGGIGSATSGTLAWAGRTTLGQAGKRLSERADLQNAARNGNIFTRTGARFGLYASKKAGSATFDVRNAALPTAAVGDLIRGTVGRTKTGKAIGLNDVNIPNVSMGTLGVDTGILGKGGTKGYKELKEESDKRVREREAKAASELALAQAKKDVRKGAESGATPTEIDAMEKALAKLSDKETETLVASNRELLNSLNFANAISVKQLESLNKSDQFSEEEKGRLKSMRFATINTAMAPGGGGAATVGKNIKGLSDSELEMINPEYLEKSDFVSNLRSSQFESINKSSKFTTNQKDKLRTARRKPLADAIVRRNVGDIKKILKALGPKEVSSLDMAILKIPPMLESYTPALLKRMAPEMNPADVLELHDEIIRVAATPGASTDVVRLATWLGTPDGAIFS